VSDRPALRRVDDKAVTQQIALVALQRCHG
jgi:hypothetical protein